MVGADRQVRSNLRKELMTARTVVRLVIELPWSSSSSPPATEVHSRDATGSYAVTFVAQIDTNLIPPGTQYGAIRSKAQERKLLR